jgi:rhodanese-related sulfurtransferase
MRLRKALPWLIPVAVLLAIGAYAAYTYAMDSPYRLDAARAKALYKAKDFDVVLDVRTDTERNTLGFLPGDVHIQSADLEREMPQRFPNKDIKILAYCNTGHRARMATEKLHALGYGNSYYIASGYGSLV